MDESPYIKQLEELSHKMPQFPMFLQNLFLYANDIIAVSNAKGKMVYINSYATELLGWTKDEFLAVHWIEFVHPEDKDRTKAEFRKLIDIKGYRIHCFPNRYRKKDGDYAQLCWNTTGVTNNAIYCIARHCLSPKCLRN